MDRKPKTLPKNSHTLKTVRIMYLLLILALILSCTSCENNTNGDPVSKKEPALYLDSLIKEENKRIHLGQHLETYTLDLEYIDTVQWMLTTPHYGRLIKWKRRFEGDTILQQYGMDQLENHLIIHLLGSVNNQLPINITNKRLEDIERTLTDMIGTRYKANVPVFKILKTAVYEEKNRARIKINYLLY